MRDESTADAPVPARGEVSRRGLFAMAAALGLTGAAALEFVAHAPSSVASGYEYIYPSNARVIFPGDPKGGPFDNHVLHNSSAPGVDYSGSGTTYGSAIVAVKAGTVTYVKTDNSGTYGRQVHIDHGDGSVTKYMHLEAVGTSVNSTVGQGDQVGEMGGSALDGDRTYGAHIHICLQIDGTYVDFALYVENANSQSPQEEDETMGVMYYASGPTGTTAYTTIASTTSSGAAHPGGTAVGVGSLWFQECPGAPLYPMSAGANYYTNPAFNLEYEGWADQRPTASRNQLALPSAVGKLIEARGTTVQPIGNFA